MKLTREQVQKDLDGLTPNYKTADVDRLIRRYIKEQADVSALRQCVLSEQQFHRIYFYVPLLQIKNAEERMEFIHRNLLFSDWWHTDQLIRFVADLNFEYALSYAQEYIMAEDPFVRRWGYVLFICKLCRGRAEALLGMFKDDDHYTVQMAQAWLIAELAVFQPDVIYAWLRENGLHYGVNGKAIQKISDSFRISNLWKGKFKALRPRLREQ